LDAGAWLDGYIRTYVERDVRSLGGVGDLDSFTRFIGLCAARSGQLVNLSSLGSEAGVTHTTAKRWLSVLRAGYVLDLVQPHHANFSKRLVKTPKLFFVDPGLLCHLLGVRGPRELHRHPLRGALVETLVYSELRKLFLHHGERAPLFFWRDSHGREVDFVVDYGLHRVPVEVKSGRRSRATRSARSTTIRDSPGILEVSSSTAGTSRTRAGVTPCGRGGGCRRRWTSLR